MPYPSASLYPSDALYPSETTELYPSEGLYPSESLYPRDSGSIARSIHSAFSGTGSLATILTPHKIQSSFSGEGSLSTSVKTKSVLTSKNTGTASPATVVVPADTAVGDLIVLYVAVHNSTGIGSPAGYTLLKQSLGNNTNIQVYTKTAVAGDAGSTVTISSSLGGGWFNWSMTCAVVQGGGTVSASFTKQTTGGNPDTTGPLSGFAATDKVLLFGWFNGDQASADSNKATWNTGTELSSNVNAVGASSLALTTGVTSVNPTVTASGNAAFYGFATALIAYTPPGVPKTLSSSFSGQGTLSTALTGYRRIASSFSGSGTLSTALEYNFNAINSAFSGSGSLTTLLTNYRRITSNFSGSGTLTTSGFSQPEPSKTIDSALSGEGILFSELGYVATPAALGAAPLGKLASFNVSTSAVPLNPAEGSGAAPSVNAGYIKGTDPEFAIGERNVLSWGTVGTYEGEIVRLSLPEGSDVAAISQDTALTLLNNDLTLFPFIDAAPSTWTAARAIDYWTQMAGLFYDKVPGDCIAYASGFGHVDAYGAQNTARFYEKYAGGITATTVLNGRSVKTLGSAVTGTTAFHELPKGNVAVSVPQHRKLVASIGLGLRGTGRTTTVTWNMLDSREQRHTVSVSATSAGLVSAAISGVPVASATVPGNADYRVSFSLERASDTSVVGKLTVHTDDLDGSGDLVFSSAATGITYALPSVAQLTSITHVSAGGSGAEMLRWGTYLTVAEAHPMEVPAVQKSLSQTVKEFGFVSGYEGNVWAMLNEYCAITRQDISFLDAKLWVVPRISGLTAPKGNFSRFSRDSERRDKYKQVAVVNKQSKAVSTDDAVLWRADSVFQVAAREVFETTVQTAHSILSVVQPVAVDGIWPFPYKVGGGQYVVTGADGYIIAPGWWNDNGGKVEVSLTGKEGEIAIKITAPVIDTVRAPYRISEGEADRPALYVSGSGILNDPKEVHVGTGASNAKEGFDNVFESPFIAGAMETYDTAAAMAAEYSASNADVGFELPNDFYTPSRFGQYPAGARFTDGKRNYRITTASQTHSKVSGNAVPHTTIGDYVASYPEGATLADEKARHAGRTIKQFNISPLRGSNG